MPKVHLVKYAAVLMLISLFLTGCPPEGTIINPAPQFTFHPGDGDIPLKVRFEDTSNPGNDRIYAWWWDFGDGATSNSQSPEHIYKVVGSYDVTLTITTSSGNFTVTKPGAITTTEPGIFGEPDMNNTFSAYGVSIQLPDNHDGYFVFGVQQGRGEVAIGPYAPVDILSDTYTLFNNQSSSNMFVYDNKGNIVPATLSIPILGALPASAEALGQIQLLAGLQDGRVVPIPGIVSGNKYVASVMRLPERANYLVVRRPNTITTEVLKRGAVDDAGKAAGDSTWANGFRVRACTDTEQIITALYRGTLGDENSFLRRNYSQASLEEAMGLFLLSMQETLDDLAATGLRAPALIAQNNMYTLSLFNMHPSYSYDIADLERVSDLVYQDSFFGHLVLDPAQVLAVTIRNSRIITEDAEALDYAERFSPESAFAEGLIQAVFPRYALPAISTTGNTALGLPIPADLTYAGETKAITFDQGLRDGAALFFSRRNLEFKGRGFGANEHGRLSNSSLFPYSQFVPGYSFAAHELFAWLDSTGYVGKPLSTLASALEEFPTELDQVMMNYTRPANFRDALAALYKSLDKAMKPDAPGIAAPLADAYWKFLKDYAYLNGWDAVLRPSDSLHKPYTLNEDRFDETAIIRKTLSGPSAIVDLSSGLSNEQLKNIPPLAARAIVLDLHPMTAEVELTLDTSGYVLENGYVPSVAVYHEGQDGVDFADLPTSIRNYTLIDDTGDGRTDRIRVLRLGCLEQSCTNRVVVLVANLQYDKNCDLTLGANMYSDTPTSEESILKRYVSIYEPLYEYDVAQVLDYNATAGVAEYVMTMTSGAWRGEHEMLNTIWRHKLVLIEPTNINKSTGMVFVAGGSLTDVLLSAEEMDMLEKLAKLAVDSRSAVALLTLVPNQPIVFLDEGTPREANQIIAYSFNKYLAGYDAGDLDLTWPVLLPMTRAIVRAMDTVQDFMAGKPGRTYAINDFVVAGLSERGWAAWLAAAVDDRISAVAPMAFDALNLKEQLQHQHDAYISYPADDADNEIFGGYSTAWRDYVAYDIPNRLGGEAGESLLRIVDPWRYRNALTLPKLIINSTSDRFFLPDSSRFYLDDLGGTTRLQYVPNADLSQTDGLEVDAAALATLRAFYIAQVSGNAVPTCQWNYSTDTTEITVSTSEAPLEVIYWYANAPEYRDFRLQTLGDIWIGRTVDVSEDGVYRETIGTPGNSWRGAFMQVRFAGPIADTNYTFTTPVWITPDTYPAVE